MGDKPMESSYPVPCAANIKMLCDEITRLRERDEKRQEASVRVVQEAKAGCAEVTRLKQVLEKGKVWWQHRVYPDKLTNPKGARGRRKLRREDTHRVVRVIPESEFVSGSQTKRTKASDES